MNVKRMVKKAESMSARVRAAAAPPRASKVALLDELRELARPRLPRATEEIATLIERARARWGRKVSPEESELIVTLAQMVQEPMPADFVSADEYALAFAAGLEKSDRRLTREGLAR